TREFADEVIKRIGRNPKKLTKSTLSQGAGIIEIPEYKRQNENKDLVGVDVFIDWKGSDAEVIGHKLAAIDSFKLKLKMITNRGVKVYPNGLEETYCTDHWRCRFVAIDAQIKSDIPVYTHVNYEQVVALLFKLHTDGFDVIKTENLYEFDGKRAFSLGQGE
ncbi:MAG: NADP-dependent isocitrate dehydrogenase, partial [Flavobacteriales bacterium]|nr:NADP-dependent isocitrate dehydrogenase [Flavobacteriales bacterium]